MCVSSEEGVSLERQNVLNILITSIVQSKKNNWIFLSIIDMFMNLVAKELLFA